jgi:hypothetical protein
VMPDDVLSPGRRRRDHPPQAVDLRPARQRALHAQDHPHEARGPRRVRQSLQRCQPQQGKATWTSENLPPSVEIAREIIEDLEAALEQFRLTEADLAEPPKE